MSNRIDKLPHVAYSVLERLLLTENGVKRLNPNIARMLADLDLTISAYAKRAGVARSTIFALLNPDQHPDRVGGMHPVTASKLSRAYAEAAGITPDQAYALIIVEEE
jgi:predicted transcriptional regulator